MADNITKIFEIKLDAKAFGAGIAAAKKEIEQLKAEQRALDEQVKAGISLTAEQGALYAQNSAKIKMLNESVRDYSRELEKQMKAAEIATRQEEELGSSLNALRVDLKTLTAAFDGLSRAEREGAKGQELQKKISALQGEIRAAEQATGRFQRNVGNYPTVFDLATKTMGQFGGMATKIAGKISGLANIMANFGNAAKAGTATAAGGFQTLGAVMIAPPVAMVAMVLTAIVGTIHALVNAVKSSDDASTAFAEAWAAITPVMDAAKRVMVGVAEAIAGTVLAVVNLAKNIAGYLNPAYKEAANAAQELVRAQDALEDKEREYTENVAKRAVRRSEIERQIGRSSRLTAQERINAINEVDEMERASLEEAKHIADEKYRIALADARRQGKTDDDTKNKLTDLRVATLRAEADYNKGMKMLEDKRRQALREIEAEEKKAKEERVKAAEEAAKRQLEIEKQLQEELAKRIAEDKKLLEMAADAELRAIEDATQREIAIFTAAQKKKIAEIQAMPAHTEEAEKARLLLMQEAEQAIADFAKKKYEEAEQARIKAASDAIEAAAQKERNRLALLLSAVAQHGEDALALRLKQMQLEEEAELRATERTEEEKAAIAAKYQRQRLEAEMQFTKKVQEEQVKTLELAARRAVLDAGQNAVALARANLDAQKQMLDAMLAMSDKQAIAMYGSLEEYSLKIKELQANVAISAVTLNNVAFEQAANIAGAFSEAASVAAEAFTSMGEDGAAFAAFSKALALAEMAIESGKAIAAVTSMAAMGDPYTYAIRLATAVTSVLATIATATKMITAAKVPSVPKFARGGLVEGQGSSTSDSVTARLSRGESVITAAATRSFGPLLSAINQDGGGVSFGATGTGVGSGLDEMAKNIGREVGKQILKMPAPVVSVVDINEGQQRVQILDNL